MRDDAAFQRALSLGNMGEKLVCRYLRSTGCGVVPSYEFAGKDGQKAPRLMFESKGFAIPDLDVCKAGTRSWIEIKTYHGPAPNYRHGFLVHGIPKRLASDYAAVEFETGTAVFVAILELDSGALLVARLSTLAKSFIGCQCTACSNGAEHRCSAKIKRGVYWPREKMKQWHVFTREELDPIRAAKAAA